MGDVAIRLGASFDIASSAEVKEAVREGNMDLFGKLSADKRKFTHLRIPVGVVDNGDLDGYVLLDFGAPPADHVWALNEVCVVFNQDSLEAYTNSLWSLFIGPLPRVNDNRLVAGTPLNAVGPIIRPLMAYNQVAAFPRESIVVNPMEHLYAVLFFGDDDPASTVCGGVASVSQTRGSSLLREYT